MGETSAFGNLSPANFDEQDLMDAVVSTHDNPDNFFAPPGMNPDMLRQLVIATHKANVDAGRELTYASAFSWGVTIGVLAERIRRERLEG